MRVASVLDRAGWLTDRAILAVDTYLLGRLGVVPAGPLPLLDALPLYEAVDVLERVGALSMGGHSKRWHNATTLRRTWNELLAEGYAVLSGGGLPDVLDRAFDAGAGARPTLTTAYGWFYHWLNGKGGRAFSEELTRTVVEHAESRFVVDKRVRAAMLPPTQTCTFVEAARRCNVGQTVMRDILEQRGLIDRRERMRGVAFHVPEPEIAAIEGALRSSVDLAGVKATLATSRAVVMGLIESGLLTPFVKGGRAADQARPRVPDGRCPRPVGWSRPRSAAPGGAGPG